MAKPSDTPNPIPTPGTARVAPAGSIADTSATIPCPPPELEDAGPESAELERNLRPCGVLVVESDPDLQWRLARMLTVEGNRVVGTSSGDGALALVAEWPVDLVLVSEELPGMEGIEVIRHLHERCPSLVSLLLVEEDSADLRAAARLAGASACIRKPKDLLQLEAIIHRLPLPEDVRAPIRPATVQATDAAE